MRRAKIVGQPGAGKPALARRLGAVAGLPVVHAGALTWAPGRAARPPEERLRRMREAEARDRRIVEGGIGETWPERLARADTLVVLLPVARRLARIVRRPAGGWGRPRPDTPGRSETPRADFLLDVRRARRSSRRRLDALLPDPPRHATVHCVRGRRDAERLLREARRGLAVA